jgi:hypothetical protein
MISLLTILIGVLALALIVAGIAAAIAPPRPKRTASVKAAYGRQAERRIRDQLYDTRADLTHHHPRPRPDRQHTKAGRASGSPTECEPVNTLGASQITNSASASTTAAPCWGKRYRTAGKRPPGRRDRCRRDPAASLDPHWKRSIARGESPAPLP